MVVAVSGSEMVVDKSDGGGKESRAMEALARLSESTVIKRLIGLIN